MAELCRNCHADCTEDIALAKPKKPFRCKCTSAEFYYVADDPKVDYALNVNDRRLLRRLLILEDVT